jgi:hypothetical protein
MRLTFATALALLATAGCDRAPPQPRVEVEGAYVQLPAVPGRPGAAYFTLKSNNDPTKLVSVTSPKIWRIEFHTMAQEGGISRMRPLQDTTFQEKKLTFAPGGNHAMLFDIDRTLKAGDKVPLTFTFDPAPPVTVEAEVRAFGGGHAGH